MRLTETNDLSEMCLQYRLLFLSSSKSCLINFVSLLSFDVVDERENFSKQQTEQQQRLLSLENTMIY